MRVQLILISIFLLLAQLNAIELRAQRVTLDVKGQNLQQVLREIRKQTGYDFVYSPETLRENALPVYISVRNTPISAMLKELFDAQSNLQYTIDQNTVIVREKVRKPVERIVSDEIIIEEVQNPIRGRVTNEKGVALEGASIYVLDAQGRRTSVQTKTDEQGNFALDAVDEGVGLEVSFLGFIPQKLVAKTAMGTIVMKASLEEVEEVAVQVISTGYQQLPKERATGSFVQIDNTLFNRKVGSNVLDRLADVTPGLIFNNGKFAAARMRIRGESSIHSDGSALIIVDNFPYEGDINNINPNDVENITVLKDAAAASIWGARAGNGVIVITTKRNNHSMEPKVSFNLNNSFGQRPDLHYQPLMSIADFVDFEKMLFDRGFYTTYENSLNKVPLNPAVELMILKRDNPDRAAEYDMEIEKLKGYDVRNDYERYLYRGFVQQQYAFRAEGGNEANRYFASFGYDKNQTEVVRNQGDRFTGTVGNTINLFNDKLELSGQAAFTFNRFENNGLSEITYNGYLGIPTTKIYPYARLADENGNPLEVAKNFRLDYLNSIVDDGLLDWSYVPLQDRDNLDNTTKGRDLRLDAGLKYRILKGINVQAQYQYWNGGSLNRELHNLRSYYARNEINRFTKKDLSTDNLSYPIPMGSILDQNSSQSYAHNLRLQADFQFEVADVHEINGIAGYEIRDQQFDGEVSRLYGYDERVGVSQSVNYKDFYTSYFNQYNAYNLIPFLDRESGSVDRFRSVFSNVSYAYDNRFTATGSLRFDESNLFGVKANQKRVPLYSVGLGWHLTRENVFETTWIDRLYLRATYGRAGNINRDLTAYTTASYNSRDPLTLLPYATIRTPRNPNLKWEKVTTTNFGLDFSFLKSKISGSIDYFNKNGDDVIGVISSPGSTGVKTITGNFAKTNAKGIEFVLNTTPINKSIKWSNQILFNTIKDKVVSYEGPPLSPLNLMGSSDGLSVFPIEGKPYWALYSLPWGGLDPENGDPIGYLNGEPSKDYAAIMNGLTMESLVYHGPVRPTRYGAFRNNIEWKNLMFSFNISYRGGYYFKKETMDVSQPLSGIITHGDYDKAWKKPGDEKKNQIPSIKEPIDANRERLYLYSAARIFSADHIRLQDIRLEYQFPINDWRIKGISSASIYAYANNLGLIWKKSDTEYDPDYANLTYLPVKTLSLGINLIL